MILAVDVGNTQIEMGIFKNGTLLRSWRVATGIDRTEDEFVVFVQHFLGLENIEPNSLKGVALSSVVPNVTFMFEKMCQKYLQLNPFVVDHTVKLGIKILYADPSEVGADRLCSAVAAFQRFKKAVVVIDFGTATTLDVINSRGEYLGGIISPGIETTAWALYRRAAKLPKIILEFPDKTIGKSTAESMQSGIMVGSVKMLDGLLKNISTELGEFPKVIATGGLSKVIQPQSKFIEEYFPHLVLEGLYEIYKMNN